MYIPNSSNQTIDEEITCILDDPTVSNWLKNALRSAINRDCVDAFHDSVLLTKLIARRLKSVEESALATMQRLDIEPPFGESNE
ncbi:hypothetical protein ECAE60S_04502 [Eoetvoesiella caeni]